VIEYILQQQAGPLFWRQVDHHPLQRGSDHNADRLGCVDPIRLRGRCLRPGAKLAAAERVNASIVRDGEQPGSQRAALDNRVQLAVGVEKGLLHHILPLRGGAGHPRAISMQLRAKVRYCLQERDIASLEQAAFRLVSKLGHAQLDVWRA